MDLIKSFFIAASGLRAQSERLRVISENVANSGSTGSTPGADPYQRKTISFRSVFDREVGASLVKINPVGRDQSPFSLRYEPNHPAANQEGYVSYPNVNGLIEMADMREAQRTYEANLAVMETTRHLAGTTLQILRS